MTKFDFKPFWYAYHSTTRYMKQEVGTARDLGIADAARTRYETPMIRSILMYYVN